MKIYFSFNVLFLVSVLVVFIFVCGEFVLIENIVEVVFGNENVSILVEVLGVVELVFVLEGEGFFMVFVLINVVFEAFFEGVFEVLLKFENKDVLIVIFCYYVVVFKLIVIEIKEVLSMVIEGYIVEIFNGVVFIVIFEGDVVKFVDVQGNIVNVIRIDFMVLNGVIYIIDVVLLLGGVDFVVFLGLVDIVGVVMDNE